METDLINTASIQAQHHRIRTPVSKAGRFTLHLLEMLLAMMAGMVVPMVAWMILRGHGRLHSAEMAFAMFTPVAVIIALREMGADASLPWLADIGHMASFFGMIIAMLYRRDHYIGKVGHLAHATQNAIS